MQEIDQPEMLPIVNEPLSSLAVACQDAITATMTPVPTPVAVLPFNSVDCAVRNADCITTTTPTPVADPPFDLEDWVVRNAEYINNGEDSEDADEEDDPEVDDEDDIDVDNEDGSEIYSSWNSEDEDSENLVTFPTLKLLGAKGWRSKVAKKANTCARRNVTRRDCVKKTPGPGVRKHANTESPGCL